MKQNKLTRTFGLIPITFFLLIINGYTVENKLDIGRFALAGYGDVSYSYQEGKNNNAISRFIPIFLLQLSEKIHIESELEFSLDAEGKTEVEMEYADVHYFLNNYTTITAGKFLLPFGQFGPNLHPSWINKLPTAPGLYGHGGNGSIKPLLPMVSDVGANISNVFVTKFGRFLTDFYIVSGPRGGHGEEGEDTHGMEPEVAESDHDKPVEADEHGEFPEVELETAKGDNNKYPAGGGRIAYAYLPAIEIGYSYYRGNYDEDSRFLFTANAIDFTWLFSYAGFRGEFVSTSAEAEQEEGEIEFATRYGWYLQGNWQLRQLGFTLLNPMEIVLRASQILEFDEALRTTGGLNYWFEPNAVLKLAYEYTEIGHDDSDSRILTQFAFGF